MPCSTDFKNLTHVSRHDAWRADFDFLHRYSTAGINCCFECNIRFEIRWCYESFVHRQGSLCDAQSLHVYIFSAKPSEPRSKLQWYFSELSTHILPRARSTAWGSTDECRPTEGSIRTPSIRSNHRFRDVLRFYSQSAPGHRPMSLDHLPSPSSIRSRCSIAAGSNQMRFPHWWDEWRSDGRSHNRYQTTCAQVRSNRDCFLLLSTLATRCPPHELLAIVIEVQVTSKQTPNAPLRTTSWTKIPLFDHKNRLASGRWKVPLRALPIQQDESFANISTLPTVSRDLFLNRDLTSSLICIIARSSRTVLSVGSSTRGSNSVRGDAIPSFAWSLFLSTTSKLNITKHCSRVHRREAFTGATRLNSDIRCAVFVQSLYLLL